MKPLNELVAEIEKHLEEHKSVGVISIGPTRMVLDFNDASRLCAAFRAGEKMREETVCQSCGDTGYVDYVDIGVGLQGIPCGCVSHGPNPLIEAQAAWDRIVKGE